MAEYENSDELTTTCEGEIADLLQADLNLRTTDWTNSSTDLLIEEANEVQEEICESVVEEIVVEQENENYLTCIDDNCMEESIVYVFEEPIVEFELSDSHYIIQEPETYELQEPEAVEADTMESDSSQDADKNEATPAEENIDREESVVQETSKVEVSDESVNNCSENELVVNKCTLDLPISSDNSLKTCHFNENSDPLINSALIDENSKISDLEPVEVQTPVQVNSLYGDDDSNIVIEPLPKNLAENIPYPATPEIKPKSEIDESTLLMSPKIVAAPIAVTPITPTAIKTPPNMLPSVLNRNKLTPLVKSALPSKLNSPIETKSPQSDSSSSPALRTLGKEQIKKRLQSFSLLKQGITAIPIKKIISPKQPKVQLQIGEVYDEAGRKTDEKMIIKKPPKQGPTPSEKARQVIDEIEQIKREEAAIYEQTLTFMKHSMRDAHKKKSKSRIRDRERSKSPIRRDKKFDKDHSKRIRKISEDDKFRRSLENDKHRRSFENDKFKKKKVDKIVEKEKPKEEEMPQSWTEVKLRKIDFEKINKIKDKIFKFSDERNSKRGELKNPEVEDTLKKEDFLKPQLIFEYPSLLRTPIFATTEGLQRKYFPSALIRFTEKQPSVSYCENPTKSSDLFRNRKQTLSEVPEERAEIMLKIIENKNGPINSGRYVEGGWYPQEYLTESKNDVEAITSYGLSVLSEMYNDDHEENHETETEKPKDKEKKSKKKKKKHKKRKSKSKSRSSSKEKERKHDEEKEDDKKSKRSKKHEEDDENKDKNSPESELKTKSEEEIPTNKNHFKEENQEKELNEDNTPNTDEYKSNWESDEDILNEIIRTNDRASYNQPYQRSLDKNWEIDEEMPDKYDERRKVEEKDRRKGRKSSSERISEEQNRRRSEEEKRKLERSESRRSADIRPEIEDRRSMNISLSQERLPRHENRRESEDMEYRRSSMNLRRSEENIFSRHNYEKSEPKRIDNEEMSGYQSRRSSSALRRSEEKLSSRHSFEKSESKKSDYKFEHEENTDYETRRPSSNLRRSEDNERFRQHSESDYKKSRESIERNDYERHRKLSDSDRYKKTSDASKHEDEKRSRHSLEQDRRKSNDFKEERVRNEPDNRKSQEFEHKKSRFDSEEKYEHKKPIEEKSRVSSDRDHKKSKENRHEPFEKSRDRKFESEESSEKDRHLPNYKSEERDHHSSKETKNFDHKRRTEIEENKIDRISREKKLSCSSDDRKRDSKSEQSQTPDSKKIERARHEEKKIENMVYHKWSSEEDIHKNVTVKHDKRKFEDKTTKHIDSSFQLNLNLKYQKSQWSSDEEFDRQRTLSDERQSRHYEDDFQFIDKEKTRKPRSKTRWGDSISDNGSETYENLLDADLVNLKDLERNRKLAEEKREKDEYSRKSSKKKAKAGKKKAEEKEKERKRNRKKSKDKKAKLKSKKSKEKKPKVKINYSDLEDSYDEDFKTAKQKQQDLFIKVENSKKYAAKIKIDYSDFDLSLSESKDKYNKKVEDTLQTPPESSKNVDVPVIPHTPKERKMNIDLSEIIIIDHQTIPVKNVDNESTEVLATTVKNVESINSKTPDLLPKAIPETPESPIIISPESPKPTQKSSELSKPISKTPELPKTIPKSPEVSKSIPSNDSLTHQEIVTPTNIKIQEIPEEKTPKIIKNTELKIEGITPIIPKGNNSPLMVTPTVATIKILPDISPVAAPVLPIPKPVIDLPVTPVTPDPSKLVSEYEEFMKAVCFDEATDDIVVETSSEVKEKLIVSEPEKQNKEDVEEKLIEEPNDESKNDDESDSSLEETSSEYESSEEEHSDTSSESESLSPDSAKIKMLETVAKIKTEKFTDSENSQESRTEKRKRNERDSSSDRETFENIVVKIEKDTKKMKKSDEVKTFECESKYDKVIDWEKSCVDNTNLYKNYEEPNTKLYKNYEEPNTNLYRNYEQPNKFSIDISEMMPPCVLPENIPLPNDNLVATMAIQDIPTPDFSSYMQSPIEVINISSDSTTPSPTKKIRSFIPIKLLTAESRKQANETAKLTPSDKTAGFGKFTPKDLVTQDEEKVISVGSSSDISLSNSESFSTVTANETADDQEQNTSRKRQSQWALNIITPSKKPLLQTKPIGEDDSDEDFTDKFIKQTDKKQDIKKTEESKDKEKPELSTKEPPKSEPSTREDKKDDKKTSSHESRKPREEDDKSRKPCDKSREKPRHSPDRHKDDHKSDRRSPTPKFDKDKRTPRRLSRERTDRHDKNDRNDRNNKSRDSLDKKPNRNRDHPMKESLRDREKRRLLDRRLSDRKPAFPRGRSPRNRYSRERELLRGRPQDRSKDRGLNKHKEPERNHERDRSRERIREVDRSRDKDVRERDDRRNYRKDDRRYSRSQSPHRKDYRDLDNIPIPHRPDDTDFSATSMDIVQSPVNSPLDGFKRSLADSTISDSELITQLNTPDESNEPSPAYSHLQQYYPQVQDIPPRQSPSSPKRISLDDRINLVLGLEKEPPKAIDTVCTRGPYTNNTPQNYDPYAYSRSEYDLYNSQPQQSEGYPAPAYSNQYQTPYYPNQLNTDNNIKVVQVGNVIQVVPTEQPIAHQSTSSVVPIPKAPEAPPKVVQVGNMLQIVPMTIIETTAISSPVITVEPPPIVVEKPVVVVPKSTDQLVQERRAEKEKRRQEREQRRKEKERKRKEKEKRRQQKIKTKTENMIKRALLLETGEGELDISNIDAEPPPVETTDNNNLPLSWPPASALAPVLLPKPPSKGILVSHGFREKDESSLDDSTETRKVVKFADGICPGEGTSPSGGEELPSPPPPPRKLPKEKRYKRIKSNKNKKKIKVKIIRTQQQIAEEESSSEDNLPPPPPPPGSPPPHLWPPRVKQPPVNNIHPSLPASVFPHGPPTYPAPQQVMYPPAYPPLAPAGQPVPVVIGHAPPPPSQRQHHPPVMPVLQTGPPPAPPHHGAHQSSFHH